MDPALVVSYPDYGFCLQYAVSIAEKNGLLKTGIAMESLGNDDVSALNAHKYEMARDA